MSTCADVEQTNPKRGFGVLLRAWAQRVALLMAGAVFALLLGEVLVRWLAPQQLTILRADVWVADDVLGWQRAPHLDTRINTGERTVRLFTDDFGRRIGSAGPPSKPEVRVLALGDSFLEALQVEFEDSFAGLLQEALESELGASTRVVAAGVAGYDPNHYLLQARQELTRDAYDAIVVFLFLGNDVVHMRQDRIPPRTPQTVHDFRWPRSSQPHELIDSLLYPLNDVLERNSHLFILLRIRLPFIKRRLIAIRHANQRMSDAEARFRSHVLNPDLAGSPRWRMTAELCADIQELAGAQGVPTLFVMLPRKSWVDPDDLRSEAAGLGIDPDRLDVEQPFREMRRELDRRNLRYLDTFPAFEAAWENGQRRLFGRVDTHLAPDGHRLVADLTFGPLLDMLATAADMELGTDAGVGSRPETGSSTDSKEP
ncbi:MAG: SGNH/GDSL hydrolase family protein [Thermoanaerobaculia bacterium]|nr:SGNH/GDSL hydrolase family protein [Thermoanaerobaculia bacterium]